MNQSPAQVARLFFIPSRLQLRFGAARLASLPSLLLCIPLSWCPPLSFGPASRFPLRPPSRGATRESILRLKRFVNYFFQLFSSNAGERVCVNLSIFAVHNEGGARQNFLKLHVRETAFHDLCGAPSLYEKSVLRGARGGVMAFALISRRRRCVWATERTRGSFRRIAAALQVLGSRAKL